MALTLSTHASHPSMNAPYRLIVVVVTGTGTGSITVPHGLGVTPWNVWIANVSAAAGPAAGPVVFLDETGVANGADATNIYLFFGGPGTCRVLVG
jgi:hypothetical protein